MVPIRIGTFNSLKEYEEQLTSLQPPNFYQRFSIAEGDLL